MQKGSGSDSARGLKRGLVISWAATPTPLGESPTRDSRTVFNARSCKDLPWASQHKGRTQPPHAHERASSINLLQPRCIRGAPNSITSMGCKGSACNGSRNVTHPLPLGFLKYIEHTRRLQVRVKFGEAGFGQEDKRARGDGKVPVMAKGLAHFRVAGANFKGTYSKRTSRGIQNRKRDLHHENIENTSFKWVKMGACCPVN